MINEELKLLVKNQGKNVIELSSGSSDNESDFSDLEEMRMQLVTQVFAEQRRLVTDQNMSDRL